ncbi:acyl-CoA dehydrogenase [Mycobacterium xenopi]|uniref:Acyl-CoA dehydrogenase n=1 Tax=Mycobacterium xenopi TaxID=1789 RepID=A0AAD1GXR1_MYCXE|nr:acyl-CoA dehydrogenase [Mycobacterium xenopi]SPX78964.1 acyl-CoA dehydrogenase [Mycobacterium xenopi]
MSERNYAGCTENEDTIKRLVFEPEHEQLRQTARQYIEREVAPNAEKWERERIVDRSAYVAAGKYGLIGFNMPERYGGGGSDDFRFNAVINEELAKWGSVAPALSLQNDVVGPYFKTLATDEQKERWLPGIITGETIVAIAMTEPGAGSDLAGIRTSAVRDGDDWIINGSKTFISSGINCDLVVVVARTDPEAGHKGFTLLVVERGTKGFTRGRKLDKMGLHSQDTAELHFENVRVPASNVLGQEGRGFYHLMHNLPSERLSIAISAIAGARETWRQTLQYAKDRKAFGQPIGTFQHNRFLLAEMDTELEIGEQYIDRCLQAVVDGELTAVEAAKAKWWCTELAKKVIDGCVQLHGGYGYMNEYRVARDYVDSRIYTIFGGTTEIMKDIIGRDLGL